LVSFMKSFRRSVDRLIFNTSYLLRKRVLPLYTMIILFSIMTSLSIVYNTPAILYALTLLILVIVELLMIGMSIHVIEEIKTGVAEIYLVAGLSRREYILSWILSLIIYPAIALTLSIIIPLFIINPGMITEQAITGGGLSTPLGLLACGAGVQLFTHTLIAILISIIKRDKYWGWIVIVLLSIGYPLLSLIFVAMFSFIIYDPVDALLTYWYSQLPFSPIYSLAILDTIPTSYYYYPHYIFPETIKLYKVLSILVPLAISLTLLVIFIVFLKKSYEV